MKKYLYSLYKGIGHFTLSCRAMPGHRSVDGMHPKLYAEHIKIKRKHYYLVKNGLYFLPLGGSNEIGMNLNLYHCNGKWLIVDMGVSFSEQLGVEVLMPDISFLKDKLKDIVGIVLTHAHEDHIGALPYLWGDVRIPMYATRFTAEVIRGKLKETAFKNAPLIEVPLSGKISLSPFEIEFITLTHSIPEPNALAIKTPHGTILHTGDWKIDPRPLVGEVTDADRLKALGDDGVLAMVCDSTNVFQEGSAGSEGVMRDNLMDVVKRYPNQRITVACFASNIARMETAALAAKETGRTLIAIGRSIEKMEMAARHAGYLKGVPKFQNDRELKNLSPERTMILCTGSQGESRSALARISHGTHPSVSLRAGDVVIFSARTIPGNERHVGLIQNKLTRDGATIVTASDEEIHVSGHPHRGELKQMYDWVRPKILVPVHGEARHLYEHRRFALACGIHESVIPDNGTLIQLAPGPARIIDETIPVGRLAYDGHRMISSDSVILKERQKLALNGSISINCVVKKNKVIQPPSVVMHGLCEMGEDTDHLTQEIQDLITRLWKEDHGSDRKKKDALYQGVRRQCFLRCGKKPITDIHIVSI